MLTWGTKNTKIGIFNGQKIANNHKIAVIFEVFYQNVLLTLTYQVNIFKKNIEIVF